MFNKLMNKVSEPVGVAFTGIKEAFVRYNSEEEVVLLKKVFQDILNDESKLRKDQL